ncbi:uncharacterized protein LOC121712172 isoform X1 [Alosa sapidissima]|uniref:uncharacterized protein LOC121712172 isoform X1 n=1 Tax=Alosa sapidissima TaxID=34773 RepID=UPI001C085C03|nr:uncharacterized protein LOC121712172 isoform X1 [Alosa sapidissima]
MICQCSSFTTLSLLYRAMTQEIKEAILQVLPTLAEDTLSLLLTRLNSIGVDRKSDLQYVKEEDLSEHLRPIESRKLLNKWSTDGQLRCAENLQSDNSQSDSTRSPCRLDSSSSSFSSSPTSTNSSTSTVDIDSWPDCFKVPWGKMPHAISMAVHSQKRPAPRDRREMVRIIVDEMRVIEANPSRSDCFSVAKKIVRQYPKSFADVLKDGTKIGSGYASLVNQIKSRVEHLNRDNVTARRRRGKTLPSSSTTKSTKGPSDQYGCISWQPECPTGETEDSLKGKKEQMQEMFSREGPVGGERGCVDQLMHVTYYLQRKSINASPPHTIAELRKDWPYLFTQKGLYSHFQHLTDIPILEKMEGAIAEKGKMILQFYRQKPTNSEVKQVLSMFEASGSTIVGPCVILCLMAHFKENPDGLLLQVDETATPADVERLPLPDAPRLVIQGNKFVSNKWMLTIEKQVVMTPHSSFTAGLATLFATLYTFNLEYQEEASCVLEFIQRCFVGINPDTGSKASSGKKKRHTINVKVCTLLRKLMDFDWLGF